MNTHSPSFWMAVIAVICVVLTFPSIGFPYGLHLACILLALAIIFSGARG